MNATEAIFLADQTRPNDFEPELKLRWLSALDGQVQAELYDAHLPGPEDGPGDPEALRIPWPWDDIYVRYLVMRIDLENGELDRYNNDALAFNRIYRSFACHYVHTHTPKGVPELRF